MSPKRNSHLGLRSVLLGMGIWVAVSIVVELFSPLSWRQGTSPVGCISSISGLSAALVYYYWRRSTQVAVDSERQPVSRVPTEPEQTWGTVEGGSAVETSAEESAVTNELPLSVASSELRDGGHGDGGGPAKEDELSLPVEPVDVRACQRLADVHMRRREYDKAILEYTTALKANSDDASTVASAYAGRGYAYLAKGDRLRAFADFQRWLELEPGQQMRAIAQKELSLLDAMPARPSSGTEPRQAPALCDQETGAIEGETQPEPALIRAPDWTSGIIVVICVILAALIIWVAYSAMSGTPY